MTRETGQVLPVGVPDRKRHTRLQRYERLVRRLRQRIFDYEGVQEVKADRILRRAITIMARYRPPEPTDQWGATASDRRNLARHGMAWGD